MKRLVFAAATAALMTAFAAEAADTPNVAYVPRQPPPPNVPADMNVTCANKPEFTALADKCPVIRYQGMTTWIFSYKDNRWSMALVTYDPNYRIVRNVEHKGARYIVNATVSAKTQQITLVGQDYKTVTLPWSDFGK